MRPRLTFKSESTAKIRRALGCDRCGSSGWRTWFNASGKLLYESPVVPPVLACMDTQNRIFFGQHGGETILAMRSLLHQSASCFTLNRVLGMSSYRPPRKGDHGLPRIHLCRVALPLRGVGRGARDVYDE